MEIHKCDYCTEILDYTIPISISFSWGRKMDGMIAEFCNIRCAIEFLADEIKKGNIE